MTASESCSGAAAGALGSTWDGGPGHMLNGVGGIVWVRMSCRVSGMFLRILAVFPAVSLLCSLPRPGTSVLGAGSQHRAEAPAAVLLAMRLCRAVHFSSPAPLCCISFSGWKCLFSAGKNIWLQIRIR